MMIIDTHVWTGNWPFDNHPGFSAEQAASRLAECGITRGMISHLGTLFATDTAPANASLIAECQAHPSLSPVPILNPTIPGWLEQLEEYQAIETVRAVKICPNYHNYTLRSRAVNALVAAVSRTRLKLIIQIRLIDERSRYFALNIKGVPVADLHAILSRHPRLHPLLLGIYLKEVQELADLASNFSSDLSMVDWLRPLEVLRRKLPASRILFGSNTPFLTTAAVLQKLTSSAVPADKRQLVSAGNARRFFGDW